MFNSFKKLFLTILLLIPILFSCEKDNNTGSKKPDEDSKLKNIEFKGADNQNQTFRLKAKKGVISNNNLVQMQDIELYIFKGKVKYYSIFSKNGTYLKSENLIKLNKNTAFTSSGKINFKSENLQISEKTNLLQAKKVSINYYKNKISGESLIINNNFNSFKLLKAEARLKY